MQVTIGETSNITDCFLCNPDKERVILSDDNFYGIVGLGPIVEGYLVLASRRHYKSMLDLPENLSLEYQTFKDRVKRLVEKEYGTCILTEHGRIPFCSFDKGGHDPHCYHAHQLLFPLSLDLEPLLRKKFDLIHVESVFAARNIIPRDKEYILYERDTGDLFVAIALNSTRQMMRLLVATALNVPEKADWKSSPEWNKVDNAKRKYLNGVSNSIG